MTTELDAKLLTSAIETSRAHRQRGETGNNHDTSAITALIPKLSRFFDPDTNPPIALVTTLFAELGAEVPLKESEYDLVVWKGRGFYRRDKIKSSKEERLSFFAAVEAFCGDSTEPERHPSDFIPFLIESASRIAREALVSGHQ